MAGLPKMREWLRGENLVLAGLGLATVLIHLVVINHYGYFRDELYYMACGEHLDWGYVDFPPLIGLVAYVVRGTLGDSLLAIRILPVLAGASIVVLTGLMARALV